MKKIITCAALMGISSNALAAGSAAQPEGFNWQSMALLLVFVGIFYLLMIRPQMKRNKEHKNLLETLNKGDEVVTSGGLMGKVIKVGPQFVELEVADKVIMKVQKQAVVNLLPKGSSKAE